VGAEIDRKPGDLLHVRQRGVAGSGIIELERQAGPPDRCQGRLQYPGLGDAWVGDRKDSTGLQAAGQVPGAFGGARPEQNLWGGGESEGAGRGSQAQSSITRLPSPSTCPATPGGTSAVWPG